MYKKKHYSLIFINGETKMVSYVLRKFDEIGPIWSKFKKKLPQMYIKKLLHCVN